MTSGGQCVMTAETTLMQLWSAGNLDMHTLEVSIFFCEHKFIVYSIMVKCIACAITYRWQSIQQCLLWYRKWTDLLR